MHNWTDQDWIDYLAGSDERHRRCLEKAAQVLETAAAEYDKLKPRVQRKLPFALSSAHLRNEAGRCHDILSLNSRTVDPPVTVIPR